jgi:hypothetical protein
VSQNMRAQSDPWYSNFLLKIGNGLEESDANDYVRTGASEDRWMVAPGCDE